MAEEGALIEGGLSIEITFPRSNSKRPGAGTSPYPLVVPEMPTNKQ
jgi:hypothetical protein